MNSIDENELKSSRLTQSSLWVKEVSVAESYGATYFSADDVIEAYYRGKTDALESTKKLILEKLSTNVNKAGADTRRIYEHAKTNIGFHPISAFLRIESWDNFTVLIVIPENEFLSDRILELYDFIAKVEQTVKDEWYNLNVSLCTIGSETEIDYKPLHSDGFMLALSEGINE